MPTLHERRRDPRYRCSGPTDFRILGWHLRHGHILNLCIHGCLIAPHQATGYEPGDNLDLRFEVNHLTFRADAVVRSIHADGAIGAEILYLSGRSRTQLSELIAELAASDTLNS